MIRYYIIADFFYKDFTGGAELNDFSLVQRFNERGITVEEKYCKDVTIDFLISNRHSRFIIANFVTLSRRIKEYIANNCNYVIYEHDHKYLSKRNPIFYKDFIAPKSEIINFHFYRKAKAVICLTQMALDVFVANTGLKNVLKVGASVWRDEDLNYILSLSKNEKNDKYAIMDSDNPIKKREECINFCTSKGIEFDLIKDKNHMEFLKKLSSYKGLVFKTGHLETCCRLVVEAKMLKCNVIMQKRAIGATSEDWFALSGEKLVERIRQISCNSVDIFLQGFGK